MTICNRDKKNKYYLYFTIAFLVVCALVFGWYFLSGRTFIWSDANNINASKDGYSQHYRAIVYYSKYLKEIIKNIIINHQFIIPNWNFSIGEGADILGTLNYYVIGDPFTFLSVLVPIKFMWVYYELIIILKIYLSGIFFSHLCFKMGNKNKYAILAGSLTYMFCFWAIYNVNRHPFFLNPMVYFPLIILGIEKILNKQKPYLFIGMVFISALSNFYFFYMIVLLTIIYTIVRLILLYKKNIKEIIINLLKIAGFSIIGLLLSSIVFMPVCYIFLSDTRMSSGISFNLIYPLSYYIKLPSIFFTTNCSYWMCMGYSAPTILAIYMLFRTKKQNLLLKILFIISIIIMLVPVFGQIFNGLSYMCNRWCWALALLVSYILVKQWDNLLSINTKDWKKISIYLAIFIVISLVFSYSKDKSVFVAVTVQILIALFTLIRLCPNWDDEGKNKKKQKALLIMIVLSIVVNGSAFNCVFGKDYASEGAKLNDLIANYGEDETKAIKEIAQDDNINLKNVRFSGRSLTHNANISADISSTQYYWTISNPYNSDFRNLLALRENKNHYYEGYDDRTILNTLSSVSYYAIPNEDKKGVPYGFEYKENKTELNYKIYENNNKLPLAYTYNNYITRDEWDKMNAIEKQESMLQAVVLKKDLDNIEKKKVELTSNKIPYSIKYNDKGISLNDNKFVVTSANSSITLNFKGLEKCETYFYIKGLNFEPPSEFKLSKSTLFKNKATSASLQCSASNKVTKTIEHNNKNNQYYIGKHDYAINFNYSKNAINSVTIKFSKVGIYSYDSMDIICQPMKNYESQVKTLKAYNVKNLKIENDNVNCKVSLNEPKFIVFSIPYAEGWKAYVDGKQVDLLQANVKNMGIELTKGEHNVELYYETPFLKLGTAISIVTFVFLIIYIYYVRRKKYNEN